MKKLNKKGFTLVELMVTISLLSIFVVLAYTIFWYLWDTYTRTEQKWRIESDIKQTMSKVDSTIKLSYQVTLDNKATSDEITKEATKRYLFYNTTENNLYFIDYDSETDTHLPPVKLNDYPIKVVFTNLDDAGTTRKDMLYSTISSAQEVSNYSLATSVYLANIADSVKVSKAEASYNVVEFSVAKDGTLTINAGDLPDACFIATAAYGDLDQPNVTLLRIFRDKVLTQTKAGRWFIEKYYTYSPYFANIIAQNGVLRFGARVALTPFIALAALAIYPAFTLGLCCVFGFIVHYVKKRQKARKLK